MGYLEKLHRLFASTRGQGLVEYSLILSGVAIVVIALVVIIGHEAAQPYSNAALVHALNS